VQDWRILWGGTWAAAHFRTASLRATLDLVDAIGGLPTGDADLARGISDAARELGAVPDPPAVQHIQVAIDALVTADVLPFWRAVLGYLEVGDADVLDPLRRGPTFWFQEMDAPRPQRNRIHVDVYVPEDQVEARVAAAVAAGGRIVNAENAPGWFTLADAEGNEADVAGWMTDEPTEGLAY